MWLQTSEIYQSDVYHLVAMNRLWIISALVVVVMAWPGRHLLGNSWKTCRDAGYDSDWCQIKWYECRNAGGSNQECNDYYLGYLDEIVPEDVDVTVNGKTTTVQKKDNARDEESSGSIAGYLGSILTISFF